MFGVARVGCMTSIDNLARLCSCHFFAQSLPLSHIGRYPKREVLNLARFISVTKFRPLTWRVSHPYVLADRFEDVTPPEKIQADPFCDRSVTLYGYLRGSNLKQGMKVSTMSFTSLTLNQHDIARGHIQVVRLTMADDSKSRGSWQRSMKFCTRLALAGTHCWCGGL